MAALATQAKVLVIGAGVVGLACAKQLAEAGREVILLEAETAFGTGISARAILCSPCAPPSKRATPWRMHQSIGW